MKIKVDCFENSLIGLVRKVPERIEIYDNSHLQGSNCVGAMVVAGKEGFVRSQYRKFNVKNIPRAGR